VNPLKEKYLIDILNQKNELFESIKLMFLVEMKKVFVSVI
jgi:hypothetical protein